MPEDMIPAYCQECAAAGWGCDVCGNNPELEDDMDDDDVDTP